jgi:hopanoid-associated phosphorylase
MPGVLWRITSRTGTAAGNAAVLQITGGTVIVVVGLAFEARIAAGAGRQVICAGIGRDLAGAITRAITPKSRGLISFGVCGGLAPELRPGSCIVASGVRTHKGQVATDRDWSQRLLQALPHAIHGELLGVPAPLAEPESKRTLYAETGAIAADMESHVVANAAAAHNLPFAVIRVVTDPSARPIPPAALAAMRSDGTIDIWSMLRALARTPRDVGLMFRTALDARAAHATLRTSRRALGPSLGIPDFHALDLDFDRSTPRVAALQPAE